MTEEPTMFPDGDFEPLPCPDCGGDALIFDEYGDPCVWCFNCPLPIALAEPCEVSDE
jgi:hypothetical protein